MKIPHIKLEIRILFHWLHLSGKLCHQVREGNRLGWVGRVEWRCGDHYMYLVPQQDQDCRDGI